jgi:hypothetical protein
MNFVLFISNRTTLPEASMFKWSMANKCALENKYNFLKQPLILDYDALPYGSFRNYSICDFVCFIIALSKCI